MAILKDLIVSGSSRLLGKLYTNDIEIGGEINAEGGLHVGKNTAANANIYLNNKLAMRGIDRYLRINDTSAFTSGVYFGSSAVWTNGNLYIGDGTTKSIINNSSATFPVPVTFSYTTNTGGNVGLKVNGTATIATGNITTANTNKINNATNIYNKNGTIETDTIKSNKWEIVSTQNLGGDFFVAPTIMVTNGSTFTISSVSGNTITGTLKDTTNITSANFGGHTWSNNSLIKITGKLTTGSTHYILGTCDGKLTAQMNNTANTINFQITCNASTVPPAGTYTITDGTVMMYNVGGSNKVGIYMTCYGTDKYTYIDIYNGSNGNTPVARLGKLDNLKDGSGNRIKVGDILTTDYGIYTSNGFFKGKVVANGGTIAGWTIGDGYITTNSNRTTYDNTSYTGMTMTASGIGARGSATSYFNLSTGGGLTAVGATVTGVITANTGYIGGTSGWTIASQQLSSGTLASDNSMYLATKNLGNNTSIAERSGSDWRLTVGSKFGVTNTGAIYSTGGKIGGFNITTNAIYSTTNALGTTANNVYVGTEGISLGTTFKVTKAGVLNATDATVTGTVNATTGTFGNATNKITLGTGTSGHSSLRYGMTTLADTTNNGFYVGTDGIALGKGAFKVTSDGALTATSATIKGQINATSGFIGQNATNGFNISASAIYNPSDKSTLNSNLDGVYFGRDGISLGDTFRVTRTGELTSTNGTIGGWTIGEKYIESEIIDEDNYKRNIILSNDELFYGLSFKGENGNYATDMSVNDFLLTGWTMTKTSKTDIEELHGYYLVNKIELENKRPSGETYQISISPSSITTTYKTSDNTRIVPISTWTTRSGTTIDLDESVTIRLGGIIEPPMKITNTNAEFNIPLSAPNIGEPYDDTLQKQITTAGIDTFVDGASIEIPSGVYFIVGTWTFETGSSSGGRNMEVRLTDSNGNVIGNARNRIYAAGNNYAVLQAVFAGELSAGTYKVRGSCSMKTNTTGATSIRAIQSA